MNKAKLLVAVVSSIAGIAFTGTKSEAKLYPDCGMVVEVNKIQGDDPYELVIEMQNGNLFSKTTDESDWCEDDMIALIMDDNGTPSVKDDIIIASKYVGWEAVPETWNKPLDSRAKQIMKEVKRKYVKTQKRESKS